MSDGLLMNLAAIERSDHMTSPHADEYVVDGWYRATITDLIKVVREQHAELRELRAAPSPPSTNTSDGSPGSTESAAGSEQ